jgi:predicted transcriptional regulator
MKNVKLVPIFIVFISFVLFSSTVNAVNLNNWNIDISINEDKSTDWTVTLEYEENVAKSDYFILADVTNIEVFADNLPIECSVSTKIGTTIICDKIYAKKIVYKFKIQNFIESVQNLFIFKYRFSITQLTDKFSLVVRLPLGTAIVEKNKIEGTGLRRFEPAWGREGSDGRRIYVEWIIHDPKLGETFDASVIYERIIVIDQPSFIYSIAIIIIAVIIAIIYFIKFRRTIEDILLVLTENERKIMEIIFKEKTVDQRKIVKETDFSKAKVSRIIHDLIKRGLIEKRQKGRTNIIKLKRIKRFEKIKEKEKQ